MILHNSLHLPEWWKCCPGRCISNQPCSMLCLCWVSLCAHKDLTTVYYCCPTLLWHSHCPHTLTPPIAFPLLSLMLCRLFSFWLSQWFSTLLDDFLSTFRSLLPCFPPPPILPETFPDPQLHIPYCTPSRDSLHRKAPLFAWDVLEGRSWGWGCTRCSQWFGEKWDPCSLSNFAKWCSSKQSLAHTTSLFLVFFTAVGLSCPPLLWEEVSSITQLAQV